MSARNLIKLSDSGIRLSNLATLVAPRPFCTTSTVNRSAKVNLFDLNFDRRIKVDYKESMRYLESEAFKKTYLDQPVWAFYKRNHKAQVPRENTRPNCVGPDGMLVTSYPCTICRDEYLVLHPENAKLLSHFIDPHRGTIISRKIHGLCLKQYRNLVIAITQAKDLGNLTYQIPDRLYDYSDYYEQDEHC